MPEIILGIVQAGKLFRWGMLMLVAIIIIAFSSCKKEQITTDKTAMLAFSTDSVKFDTVFTTINSPTINFIVHNLNKKAVNISSIRLGGGAASYFKINVDGHPGPQITNYTLAGGDSLFVFVQVAINPSNKSTPFIVTDSILFTTNGNLQMVKLMAFGQNAHFYASQAIGNTIWSDTVEPYVIYNSILVIPGCTLTINKGVKVYSHSGSAIIVQGSLNVYGSRYHPVTFQADRLDQFYATAPGQWYGIWFATSPGSIGNGSFNNAIIKNGVIGIEADSSITGDTLRINKTVIQNMTTAGIIGKSANITGKDLLVNNCGQYLFLGEFGGNYNFAYSTFDNSDAAITSASASVILANNDYTNAAGATIKYPLTGNFTDCIIWGAATDEVEFDNVGDTNFTTNFKYNILKTSLSFNSTNKLNSDPQFNNPYNGNYHFASMSSPAINFSPYTIGDTLGVLYSLDSAARAGTRQPPTNDVAGCYVK